MSLVRHEFIQYCHSTNATRTLETLKRFGSEKGLREGASDIPLQSPT